MFGIFCKICFFEFLQGELVFNGGLVLKYYYFLLIIFLVFFDLFFMYKDFNIYILYIFQLLNYWKSKSDGYFGGKCFNCLKILLDFFFENNYFVIFNNYYNIRKLFL